MVPSLGWERGRQAMSVLPKWLFFLLLPWYIWLDIIVPRPRVVFSASVAAFTLLAVLKWRVGIPNGENELGWGEVWLLSVGLFWFPFMMITVIYPFYLASVAVLWIVSRIDQHRK